jgi:hypothetical protein
MMVIGSLLFSYIEKSEKKIIKSLLNMSLTQPLRLEGPDTSQGGELTPQNQVL